MTVAPGTTIHRAAAIAVVLGASVARGQGSMPAVKDIPDIHTRWHYEQRAYPFDELPPGAMLNAWQQWQGLQSASAFVAPPTLPGGSQGWVSIGPSAIDASLSTFYNGTSLVSGRVDAVAVDPSNTQIIYAGTFGGGIWKTTNGGTSWAPISDNVCSLYIGTIAVDPVNPSIIYAGTADPYNGLNALHPCGILRSTDGGASWTNYGFNQILANLGSNQSAVSKIIIDKATAGSTSTTVLIATSIRGLYRSTNSGQTWAQVSGMSGWFTDVIADPTTPAIMYAASRTFSVTEGIYKSTNTGATWTKLTNGLATTQGFGLTRLAITRTANPQTIYALAATNPSTNSAPNDLLGLYRSTDAGASWTKTGLTNGFCTAQCNYGLTVAVDPDNGNAVYVGGLWVWKATDGGATNGSFVNISQSAHVDQHALVHDPIDPATIYQGSDGGLYRSTNRGSTWTGINAGMVTALFVKGLASQPNGTVNLMGGLQDNGTVEFLGQDQWKMVMSGDGGASAYNKAGSTAWTQYVWSPPSLSQFSGPQRRDPGSSVFNYKRTGIDLNDRGEFYPPLVMDPVNDQTLYFGTYRVYRTTNNGEAWSAISPDLTASVTRGINVIKVAPSDPQTIYVGTADGRIQVTANGGTNWTLGTGNPNRFVTNFGIDNGDPTIAYATFSGYGTGHVYKTTNRGATWTNISGSTLPDMPATAVAIIPGTTEVQVATDLGVLRTTDNGANWSVFPGLPNVEVSDLVYDIVRGQLYAATYGRGAFSFALSNTLVLRGDVTADGAVGALDAQAALNHAVGLTLPANYKGAPNGDANCDGQVTAFDAQVILSYVVGLNVSQFCVGFYR